MMSVSTGLNLNRRLTASGMRRLALLLMILCGLLHSLSACVPEGEKSGVLVYYAVRGYNGQSVRAEMTAYSGGEPLAFALERMREAPQASDLQSVVPDGATVLSVTAADGTAVVEVSAEWDSLSGISKTMAEYCLLKTALQFPETTAVRLYVSGTEGATVLREEMFVDAPLRTVSAQHELKLYFASEDGQRLMPELRAVVLRESESTEWYRHVVVGLIAGPSWAGLEEVIPRGTRLLTVTLDNRICIVNLSEEFITETDKETARLGVYALVNSLTELKSVNSVLIRVEGEALADYHGLDLTEPLLRDETLIGT